MQERKIGGSCIQVGTRFSRVLKTRRGFWKDLQFGGLGVRGPSSPHSELKNLRLRVLQFGAFRFKQPFAKTGTCGEAPAWTTQTDE